MAFIAARIAARIAFAISGKNRKGRNCEFVFGRELEPK
jgi:hypothetical protein